ncbi:MAG TPA: small multi-drug export protein [Spirochaetia bacterium]|nr:small multi-drug export protein [Spirochaetia bacterium]
MTLHIFIWSGLLALLPISELRGAIPYALANGIPVVVSFLYCTALNALVAPIVYLFLSTIHRLLYRIAGYRRLFDRIIERARSKMQEKVERYGYVGVMLFVAIPLPVTGAYTGTLGAWILGLDRRKTFLAVAAGVCIAGVIVTTVSVLGIKALSIFVKH